MKLYYSIVVVFFLHFNTRSKENVIANKIALSLPYLYVYFSKLLSNIKEQYLITGKVSHYVRN